jgi:hypothetical protein
MKPSEDESIDPFQILRKLSETFYWLCFHHDIATHCHAFMEMNGVISAYINLLQHAANTGIHPRHINQHGGLQVPGEYRYHLQYLGEKMGCMFKPFLGTAENKAAFLKGFNVP